MAKNRDLMTVNKLPHTKPFAHPRVKVKDYGGNHE
jgi:hypothetical protein